MSPDGRYIACVQGQTRCRIIPVDELTATIVPDKIIPVPTDMLLDGTRETRFVRWSSDSRYLATALKNGRVMVWDLEDIRSNDK